MSHWGKTILKQGWRVFISYFSWMIPYSRKNRSKYPIEKRYKKLHDLTNHISNAFDVVYHVEGKENLPDGNLAFYPNHLSGYDPVAFISVIDRPTTFVAKKEIAKWPIVNRCVLDIDGLFMDRDDLKQSLKVMMQVEKSLKTTGWSWIIFPEGTRNKDYMMNVKEFHHGSFRPAVKAGVPIVPVAHFGTFRITKNKPQYQKYHVFIKFLKPIMPEEYQNMSTQEIAIKVHDEVQKALSYDLVIKDHKEMHKDKKYKLGRL